MNKLLKIFNKAKSLHTDTESNPKNEFKLIQLKFKLATGPHILHFTFDKCRNFDRVTLTLQRKTADLVNSLI